MASNCSALAVYMLGLAFGIAIVLILEHPHDVRFLYRTVVPVRNVESVIPWSSSSPVADVDNSLKPNSQQKAQQQRILCWVMTTKLTVKGKAVKETWGKHCDTLLFMSSKADPEFPAVGLDVLEGRDKPWDKTHVGWSYVYQHHFHDAEWFVKADDETYMIIENLRYLLSNVNSSEPRYLGRHLMGEDQHKTEGPVYIFSSEMLRRFKQALGESSCPKEHDDESEALRMCLKAMGVLPTNTRDSTDRETFLIFPEEDNTKSFWEESTDHAISFHNINPGMMYHMEYFVYRQSVLEPNLPT